MSRLASRLPAPLARLAARLGVHFAAHRSQGIFFAIVALGIALPILSRVPPFGALQ